MESSETAAASPPSPPVQSAESEDVLEEPLNEISPDIPQTPEDAALSERNEHGEQQDQPEDVQNESQDSNLPVAESTDVDSTSAPLPPPSLPPPPPPPPPPAPTAIEVEDLSANQVDPILPASPISPPLTDSEPELPVLKTDKDGESEQDSQEPPKSPAEKFVHFASGTKAPDYGKRKSSWKPTILGKGKPTGFVRIRDFTPPTSPLPVTKEEKTAKTANPVGIIKKTDRPSSINSVSSSEKSDGRENSPSPRTKHSETGNDLPTMGDRKLRRRKHRKDTGPLQSESEPAAESVEAKMNSSEPVDIADATGTEDASLEEKAPTSNGDTSESTSTDSESPETSTPASPTEESMSSSDVDLEPKSVDTELEPTTEPETPSEVQEEASESEKPILEGGRRCC